MQTTTVSYRMESRSRENRSSGLTREKSAALQYRTCVLLASVFIAGAVAAKTTAWKESGRANDWDWTNVSNFTEGAPASGDTVSVPSITVYATNDAARAVLASLAAVNISGYRSLSHDYGFGRVVVLVEPDATLTLSHKVYGGEVVKQGGGVLQFANADSRTAFRTSINAQEGTVAIGAYSGGGQHEMCMLSVSNGATLFLPNAELKMYGIVGSGLVTNTASSAVLYRASEGTLEKPYVFSGKLGGKFELRSYGVQFLTGTANEHAQTGVYSSSASNPGWVGLKTLGTTGQPSSRGLSYFQFCESGGGLLYLGEGERSDMSIIVNYPKSGPVRIDAGETGGLEVTGVCDLYNLSSSQASQVGVTEFILSGNGAKTNAILGPVTATYSKDASANACSSHLIKQGTGTWRLGCETNHFLHGASVDAGTLQFDSLLEKHDPSSLGTSSDPMEPYTGDYDAAHRTPYAFRLGSATSSAVFEYTGMGGVSCTTRPIALAGDATIRNATDKPFRFAGVSPLTSGAKVLTLDAAVTAENVLGGVSDTAASPITIVKAGAGTWTLSNTNTLHGALRVEGGRLVVGCPSGTYTWHKWTIKRLYATNSQQVNVSEFALYGTDNERVNGGLVKNARYALLAEGEASCGTIRWTMSDNLVRIFDSNNAVSGEGEFTNWRGFRYSVTDPTTWNPIVMRRAANAAEAVSYDLSTRYGTNNTNAKYAPTVWSLEGSVDGVTWDMLHEMADATDANEKLHLRAGNGYFYGAGTTDASNSNANGQPIAGSTNRCVNVMAGFTSVSVAAGAVLEAGTGGQEISALSLDTAGGGEINGFSFASSGTLDVSLDGRKGAVMLPTIFGGTTTNLANLGNWTLRVDGAECRSKCIVVQGGRVSIVPRGTQIHIR